MEYAVKYTDSTGIDNGVSYYDTEKEAEEAICEELEGCKEWFRSLDYYYTDSGLKVDFWVPDTNEYAQWERLWKTCEV